MPVEYENRGLAGNGHQKVTDESVGIKITEGVNFVCERMAVQYH